MSATCGPPSPWLDDRAAPNGRTVRQNFEAWFGRSQVVDGQGMPLRVFFGAVREISDFSPPSGAKPGADRHLVDAQFSSSPRDAGAQAGSKAGSNIVAVYLSLQSPCWLSAEEWRKLECHSNAQQREALRMEKLRQGHDGLASANASGMRFIAFEAHSVKSALSNSGLYQRGAASLTDTRAAGILAAAGRAMARLGGTPQRRFGSASKALHA